jgi:tellurite resistance protein
MMSKKKLAEVKAEVATLLARLPGPSPSTWLTKEIQRAKKDPNRDAETLEMLCAALEREAKKRRKPKAARRTAKR